MATITSTTSGNFNATGTWVGGVVPVDGDSFVIAAGHTVTYNVASPVTNGFNDSDVYGILQSQSGASTVLRMNGRLRIRTNGTYHARAGHTLQFKGTAADSHILYLVEESGASLIMEGSDGMPTTTLSANANEGATSFSFTSAANFAVGEWFAIYDHTTAQASNAGATTLRDEGFWVHDVSGTTVYFRQFVGPESTISSASGSTITVANSKVFRVGQKIIFGTGANLNVKTINAINYSTHIITCDSSITGTVTGLTVYETGTDKIHTSGNKVRKVATVTTASSLSSATTITVANANMFVAGNEIWIEARSECGGTTDRAYNAYGDETPGPRYRHVISSVSTNTITLNAQIGYNVVAGALVTRLTRDVIVEPVTPNTDYYGVWAGYYATNYNRKLIIKDVFFRYVGSAQGQPEGGVTFRGYFSTNSPAVTLTNTVPAWNQQCWTEGIVLTGSNSTRDIGGLWNYNNRYGQFRCCTVVGRFNSGIIPGWYDGGNAAYNCISSGSEAWGYRVEHLAEWGELAYNYNSRSYWAGRHTNYDANCGFHHNIHDAITEGPQIFSQGMIPYYKYKVTGNYYGPQNERSSTQFIYSIIRSVSGIPNVFAATPGTYQRGFYHTMADRGGSDTTFNSVEDNMEYDRIRQFSYGTERWWDNTENAWRVVNAADFTDAGRGWFQTVFVPVNVSLVARCAIKLVPGFSGTYPYLAIYSSQSGVGTNQMGNAGGSWSSAISGGQQFAQYTAAAANNYETQELTLTAKPFHRWVQIGIYDADLTAQEGWWMRPTEIIMGADYPNAAFGDANRGPGLTLEEYMVSSGAISKRIRIGGRLK